jgi:hypothetical protein
MYIKTEVAQEFFVKLSNIAFQYNRVVRSMDISCIQIEGRNDLIGAPQGCQHA